MSTRYDELTKILGTGSAGTPSPTPAADDSKPLSRQDEIYSLLGGSASAAPATVASGTGATQMGTILETPKQASPQSVTPQSALPTAPLSGEPLSGRSAEQIQQEISDSRNRLAKLQSDAAYVLTAEPGAELGRQMDAERARIKALNEELNALNAPNTNAERDSLIQRMNAITENEGYATTVELADAVQQEKQETRQRLHQLDEELGNAARFYDSGERAGAVTKGALKQTGSAYTNFMGTLQGVGNRLNELSPDENAALYGIDYGELEKEEQRLYEKADTVAESAARDIEQAKEGLSALGQAGVDISTNLIQLGIDAAGKAAGLGMLPFFVRAAGGSMQEARQAGASTGQQLAYGLTKGGIEAATELLSGGIAGTGISGLDNVIEPLIDKLAKSTAGKVALSAIYDAAMEGTEEVFSDLLDPFAKMIYNDQALKEAWENRAELRSQMLYDYLIGAVVGGLGSGTKILTGAATEEVVAGKPVKTGAEMQTQEQTGAEAQAAGVSDTGATPQSAPLTAPLQGEPLSTQQEAQAQAAEAAQDAQRATPQADTPPTTENAVQAASDELNRQTSLDGADGYYQGQIPESLDYAVPQYEKGAPRSEDDSVTLDDPFSKRDIDDAGNRKVKAYMYENPEVKPFFQFEAEVMLNDLKNITKGERFYNDRLYYDTNGEYGWTGTKRFVSDDIAYLLDYGYSYAEIEKGLKAIIEDNGAENNACSKRIEFILNDRLMDGYTDFTSGEQIPANTDYRNLIIEKQINEYSREAFESFMQTEAQNAAPAAYNRTTGQRERTDGANAVRGFSENVATDSAMEAALRREFEQNPEMYTRLANKDTLKKAQDIFIMGLDTARTELERAIGAAQSGQKFAPEMVPLSRMVANELTRQGELTAARKIISDVAAELTGAGQLGQAAAILRNADPVTVLNTLQKSIDAINAEVGKKFGKRNPWKAELTAEEIKQISETDFSQDGAFEAIQQQIAKRLGREMPATVAEKFRELRKVGMLANPKTQLKNLLGNAPLAVERKVAERLSGGIQELAVKAGIMSKEEQTRTLRVSQESKDLAKSVYKNNIDRITRKGNKGELRGILRDTRTYFNKGLLQKGIEKATGHQLNDAALDYVRRFTYDLLERGDAPFVKSAFIDSLAQYCEAQGIKSEADVTETAFSYALDQAMAATFKDASALANLLNSIKDKAGIAGEALDVLFPFTTTPINIAKEFGKYSPLGYLQLLNTKGKSAAEVIDIVSRATAGSAVVAAGAILRSLGFITGAADDDKDKAAHDKAIGISPYSILGKYSYEWAQPTGSTLAMGASIYDAAKDGGSLIEILSNGLIAAGDAYLEQSFFNDIIGLFQGYGSPSENLLTELLKSLVSQSVPSIVGAAARTTDPTVRTSYSGGNALDDALTALGIKTPGVSKGMAASVDVRGEEVRRGNLGERIWDNFIAPWTTNRNGETVNAVDKALDEVYEATGDKTIFRQVSPYKVDYGGESYQMTGNEREQFQKTQGQVHDDILQQIIDGGQWKNLSNKEKAKIMNRVNEYALDSAKRELVESRGDDYSSDWDDEAALNDTGSYFVAKIKADKDGNGRISQEELWYYLGLQKNMPASTKSELWDILTTGKTGYAQYAEKQK